VNLTRIVTGGFNLYIYQNKDEVANMRPICQEKRYSKKLRNGNIIEVVVGGFTGRYFKVIIDGIGAKGMRIVEIPKIRSAFG
jgi:hypothetical protein